MAQHKNEHRDAYIAAIVGGVVLILILLYLHSGTNAVAADLSNPLASPPVDASATPGASDYNYNVAPYNPGTPIQYAFPSMFGGDGGCGCGAGGVRGGNPCSPINGTNLYTVDVAQYQTLTGT